MIEIKHVDACSVIFTTSQISQIKYNKVVRYYHHITLSKPIQFFLMITKDLTEHDIFYDKS